MRCPVCNQAFSPQGLAIHHGMKHGVRACRWRRENRGWCVIHDAEWRIDRGRCEAREAEEDALRAALEEDR